MVTNIVFILITRSVGPVTEDKYSLKPRPFLYSTMGRVYGIKG